MQSSHTLRLWADEERAAPPEIVLFQLVRGREHGDPLRRAIARARQTLLGRQQPDGSFADPRPLDPRSLTSLALAAVFLESRPGAQLKPVVRALLLAQRADGGWSASETDTLDLSVTVLAYFVLKVSGQSSASEPMVCARRAILSRGGAGRINDAAKTWLALFGQMPYEALDAVSVERFLLRRNIDGTALCQTIVASMQPRRHIADALGIRELFQTPARSHSRIVGAVGRFFRARRILPLRRRALELGRQRLLSQVEQWDDRSTFDSSTDDLAWMSIALDILGLTADTSPRRTVSHILNRLIDWETETPILAPALPVADEAHVVEALLASGLDAGHSGVRQGLNWLSDRKIATTTDAARLLELLSSRAPQPAVESNILPPPLQACMDDDEEHDHPAAVQPTSSLEIASLANQLVAAQRGDGAWTASFPAQSRKARGLSADLGVTASALLALAETDANVPDSTKTRAIAWLRTQQHSDGSWPATGIRGAVATTSLGIRALIAAGVSEADQAVAAGTHWLLSHQQSDGGWGDASSAQDNAIAGEGPSTPRHTAAAILGLLDAGRGASEAVARGVEYLISTTAADRRWSTIRCSTVGEPAELSRTLLDIAEPLLALSHYAARPRVAMPVESLPLRIATFC